MSYPGKHFDEITKQLLFPPDYENPRARKHYHLVHFVTYSI